jgi:putative glutamine amidotransferase
MDRRGFIIPGFDFSFIHAEYGQQVEAAGGIPIYIDNTIDPKAAVELCDGILISGGEDINPMFYGQEQKFEQVLEPTERTIWERELINECDKSNIRILGICYGAQLLNVHYGGTLKQNIEVQQDGALNHGDRERNAMRDITFDHEFLGFTSGQTVTVACRHHQAVDEIAPGMQIMAHSSDGIIEAIAGYGHVGFQWHSEADGTAQQIYGSFIASLHEKGSPQQRESLIKHLLQRVYPERLERQRRTRR